MPTHSKRDQPPPPHGYTWQYDIDDAISAVGDKTRLTRMHELLLLRLLMHTNAHTGLCKLSVRQMARLMRTSFAAVIGYFNDLKGLGIVEVVADATEREARTVRVHKEAIRALESTTRRPGFRNTRPEQRSNPLETITKRQRSNPVETLMAAHRSNPVETPTEGANVSTPRRLRFNPEKPAFQPGDASVPTPLKQKEESRLSSKGVTLSSHPSAFPLSSRDKTDSPPATNEAMDASARVEEDPAEIERQSWVSEKIAAQWDLDAIIELGQRFSKGTADQLRATIAVVTARR